MPRGTTVNPTFLDLTTRECVCVRCRCGREVSLAPFQLVGKHGITQLTRIFELKDHFRCRGEDVPKATVHDRMPLVLELDEVDAWLRAEPDDAAALMKPAKEGIFQERALSKAINNVKNNSPELLT